MFRKLLTVLQVEFLCERGADVNRGLRSSSLHYAACFGRPQIVKVCSPHKCYRKTVPLPWSLELGAGVLLVTTVILQSFSLPELVVTLKHLVG